MTEQEKIVNGLLDFVEDLSPFAGNHHDWLKVHAAIKYLNEHELLEEQESYVPSPAGQDDYICGNCGETVGWEEMKCYGIESVKYKYCPECGRKVKWDA